MEASSDISFENKIQTLTKLFSFNGTSFRGEGWDHITEKIRESQNILVGEDHFSNEIPLFIKAIAEIEKFDNFYIEVDPYSTKIISDTFSLSDEERKKFNDKYQDLFSFYAMRAEYNLLEFIIKSGTNILGIDQIVMYADRLVCDELLRKTQNEEAKEFYNKISTSSEKHLAQFLKDPNNNSMYFMTPDFKEDLKSLKKLQLSELETKIIHDIEKSISIYEKQNHNERVKLLLNGVVTDLALWKNKKNLFKYGANHMCRGESFLFVHDIGNLVENITRSNFQASCHIMIVGKSGKTASPFRGFPNAEVDSEKGFYLSYLKPFFEIMENDDNKNDNNNNNISNQNWYMFDLKPLRLGLIREEYNLDNINLIRTIKGYDILVIIPEITPAEIN